MSLDPTYLEYAKRGLGYDHALYPYAPLPKRAPLTWPGGQRMAVWFTVSLEWFPITPSDTPFRAPGHMQTAYPDYRHYTSREYGTRVGFYRLLDAFAKVGAKVSVAVNAAIAQRYPEIIADILDAGHEIIAHSTDMNGTIASTLPVEQERALIAQSLATLEAATGKRPRGWHSIARSQSFATLDLLNEAGVEYCVDWANDEMPFAFNNGLVNIPLNHELSDRQILNVQQQSVDSYAQQVLDAYDWLKQEAGDGGRMLPLHLTPYIIGLPYRMDAFEGLLAELAARSDTWFARGGDIFDAFTATKG
ncbi:polysaccharide deacetylase family protein [Novosphingobium sp. KACC 22771]|uniref:polysaccharide deacetylase family protein n=1 Tax=Novosphingobium sp. KACC 22771 TaxID=3025670 RepID=UPI0023657D4F|nr:polysaccharide deacetylase family protein [Novosphingobium sp. KACC 22771]WDF74894.1 polysaccharide deacetylase family protein [Novosphingobium sp. KACC 22771]